ncbi:hypothetical protein HYU89_01420 [Candidatus Collierbacteria bacterium]|nr:hypothetical protein [Candidatus Collierbacteria bacterium]
MKRLEENLPYLGSGSAAGIEALARLTAAGVEIGFNPKAMGGGDDPFADYFGKVETAGADQTNKFLQWADEQTQRGVKTVKVQGADILLADYRARLEEIRVRKQQVIPEVTIPLAGIGTEPSLISLIDEVQALRSTREGEAEAKKKKEQEEALAQLRPEIISNKLKKISADSPMCRESVDSLERLHVPQLISESTNYLTSDGSNRFAGKGFFIEDMDSKPPYRLAAKAIGVNKGVPTLSITAFCGQPMSFLDTGKELSQHIIVNTPPENVISLRDEIAIEITQKRCFKYLAEKCFGFSYPAKEGDEFYLPESSRDTFAIRFSTMKTDGKLGLYVTVEANLGGKLIAQPNETNVKRAMVDILAGMER